MLKWHTRLLLFKSSRTQNSVVSDFWKFLKLTVFPYFPLQYILVKGIEKLGDRDTKIIHEYIHSWPLQPYSSDYWLSLSHHLCCVCVILYINDGNYSLKSTPNDRFFEKLFMTGKSFYQKSAERKSKKYFSYFIETSSI